MESHSACLVESKMVVMVCWVLSDRCLDGGQLLRDVKEEIRLEVQREP